MACVHCLPDPSLFSRSGLACETNAPINGMPYLQTLGLGEGRRGLTCPNRTSTHTWGTILRTTPPTLSLTNIPYLVHDREIHVWERDCIYNLGQARLSANPSGKIPTISHPPPPPFSIICPRYAWRGIPLTGA